MNENFENSCNTGTPVTAETSFSYRSQKILTESRRIVNDFWNLEFITEKRDGGICRNPPRRQ